MTTVLTLLALATIAWLVFRWLTSSTRKRVLHNVEVEAVDGDTIRLEGLEETIRLAARVDAPEVGQPGAEAATQAVRRALEEGEEARVVSMERGKWGAPCRGSGGGRREPVGYATGAGSNRALLTARGDRGGTRGVSGVRRPGKHRGESVSELRSPRSCAGGRARH